ncbi:OPT oligopeptide transporter protein-domain-containing protein [Lipomyces arxii]|uniref:OPT oligopeptide transporter protein-domain-containing protein n=1 Tax=Lipomyces arxii TaxID=56418 RepID=UPI0034CFC90E
MEVEEEKKSTVIEQTTSASDDADLDSTKAEKQSSGGIFTPDDFDRIAERIALASDMDDVLAEDLQYILDKVLTMNMTLAEEILKEAMEYHLEDINFPHETMERVQTLLKGEEAYGESPENYQIDFCLEATLIRYHSPYPEVRSVCTPTDDPSIPVETFRAYFIATIWVAGCCFINQLFQYRQPFLSISSQVVQILIFPCGQFMARVMPHKSIRLWRWSINLNPGPWSFKEQMFATIMGNVGAHTANFMWYLPIMKLDMFFGNHWIGYGFMWVMSFSVQFFGLGLSGILRRWCVYPVKAVWPTILPGLQLNRALLSHEKKTSINGWTISKYKLFLILLACSFLYFFIPNFLFTALSTFNWMTWIAPTNKNLAFVTGSRLGVGFNPIATFDWAVINFSSPLVVPFFSVVNMYFGAIIGALVLLGMYYSNYLYTAYMPPNTATVYDRFGMAYNSSKVVIDNRLDENLYKEYSPPYISAGYLMYMGSTYCMFTFSFVYIMLSEYKMIIESCREFWRSLKNRELSNYHRYKDPVSVLMRKYPEVPDWWFLIILALSIVACLGGIGGFPTTTPVWALIVIIAISIVFLLPTMLLYSSTGYLISLNMMSVILSAYMVPGNGIASLYCRIFGFTFDQQSESFVGDMKLAHYAKLPPRAVFRAQVWATFVQVTVTATALLWLEGLPRLCEYDQEARFTCASQHSIYSASLLLGVIGPTRTFDYLYPILKYAFLIGAVLAVPFFAIRKRFPHRFRSFQPVLVLGGVAVFGTTYNLTYYTPGMYMSFAFMYYIKRRYLAWWAKYNYIITSGLTAGTAFCGILIFVALQYHTKRVVWWGTTVQTAGVDGAIGGRRLPIPADGYFGVANGTWF